MVDYPTPNQYQGRTSKVRLVVMHSTESATNTARNVARYFQNSSVQASAHWVVGTDGAYSCVAESNTAWAAPGANHDGIQVEQAGYAYQTKWDSGDGAEVVTAAAHLVADICARHGIPIRHLSDTELANGSAGIVGHDQVSRVYKRSDHTDPGPTYPWDALINQANGKETTDMNSDQAAKLDNINYAISKIILPVLARLDQARAKQQAELTALSAALDALAAAQGIDPAKVSGIVDGAVKEALAGLEITLTTEGETK